jgi:sugar phosphate isomerase/epimerase
MGTEETKVSLYTRRNFIGGIGAAGISAASASASSVYGHSDLPRRVGGPHLRVGCCAYSYRDYLTGKKSPSMSLDDFLNRVAEIGIDGVELTSYYFPTDVNATYIHKLVRRCFLLGLDINGTAIGNRFTLPPGAERDKEIALVRRWIDYAVDMGAPSARIFAGATPAGADEVQARKWVVECIEICCEYAGNKGVVLALENHGGIVATSDGILSILKSVNSEWFGMKWDSGNFHTADPYLDLTKTAPYAVTTHIKTDINPGDKREDSDLARIVQILKNANYRGYLHLEYEGMADPLEMIPKTLKRLLALTAG